MFAIGSLFTLTPMQSAQATSQPAQAISQTSVRPLYYPSFTKYMCTDRKNRGYVEAKYVYKVFRNGRIAEKPRLNRIVAKTGTFNDYRQDHLDVRFVAPGRGYDIIMWDYSDPFGMWPGYTAKCIQHIP